jgi:16S rRNA (cytosine967-C5)-methyltransferase
MRIDLIGLGFDQPSYRQPLTSEDEAFIGWGLTKRSPIMTVLHAAPAREAALEVLSRVEEGGAFSHLALSGMLRRLDGKDRGLTTELVYGTLTYQLRLDRMIARFSSLHKTAPVLLRVLRLAVYQLLFLSKVPPHAILNDAVTQAKRVGGAKAGGFVNAVLRRLSTQREEKLPEGDSAEALAVRYSMPLWLVARRRARLTVEELEAWLRAENEPAPLTVRVLTERASVEEVRQELAAEGGIQPGLLSPRALRLQNIADPFSLRAFTEGRCVVQDEGSQAVVLAAGVSLGDKVLDACAGFGGKTLFLAELVGESGQVVSIDLLEKKLNTLQKEAKRVGLMTRITTKVLDATQPTSELLGAFSHVLLDAPCSGLGTLRRHPELRWRRTLEDLYRCGELQQRLLRAVSSLVAPGGVLIYSVCSPEPEEGEEQVEAFLAEHPDFSLSHIEAPSLAVASPREGILNTFPHLYNTDAFFIARLFRSKG